MIISSHIILTSVATMSIAAKPLTPSNAALLFFVSFFAHYILDFIPHWDYKLASFNKESSGDGGETKIRFVFNKINFLKDSAKTTLDGLLGLSVAFWLVGMPNDLERIFIFFLVASASILPDIIELFYSIYKRLPFSALSKIHKFFHTNYRFKERPRIGILFQIAIVVFSVLLAV